LEQRAERQARRPGNVPAARRQRAARTQTRRGGRSINWLPIIIGAGALAVVALILYSVIQAGNEDTSLASWQEAELDDDARLPGAYIQPHPGADGLYGNTDDRAHFANGIVYPICTAEQIASNDIFEPVCYTSNPPTSGPHAASPMTFKVLENPAPKENLIHNMEHGGVVVWVNTNNAEVIRELESVVNNALDRRRLVVMSRYSEMEPETIAVTSWTRLDKFPVSEFTNKRVSDFIEEHQRRFNPEGF
jgi:hypothetical protein